ncbi:hypothetical protein HG535_0H01400 [Zygotorulaspora mrakii]|uniref:PPIase cyclophilin-type domain-containing protein n=1 Tax=Zygotorulaspora mrakii TaxID=42260 RepID=A0A7H9B8G2_ZYGMR|nr:uncharacterized protein HG535_0H01400 [Zygotorulaspora mrakii]QLG74813.1 hypothetical protein HG535_0H01400 [Zygotorulaspora mrakii]
MQEPQTTAKCIIYTSKGRLDVELWCKEIPTASRKFLEDCQLGKLKDEAIYEISGDGKTIFFSHNRSDNLSLPTETNDRIKFNRNGILGWDNNTNRWFMTLKEYTTQDTDNKVIAGKIVDGSFYTLKAIADSSEVRPDGLLLYPAHVKETEITIPYFKDLPQVKTIQSKILEEIRPKKLTKVRLLYEDEDEDDNEDGYKDEDENNELPSRKRMCIKMPKGIKVQVEPTVYPAGTDSDASRAQHLDCLEETDDQGEEITEAAQKYLFQQDEKANRERKTLIMLDIFKKNVKGKNILKKGI